MVHLQNRTRYVSNPDGILSSTAVTTMDSILYALEQKTGIQTLVVAVTGIEGGDCFDFAHRLGQETGVGQKERDNGLVILLSTDERCVQFATGYGLEGILPDAICKRIQNRYMLPYFKDNNWNAGMVAGIRAVNGYRTVPWKISAMTKAKMIPWNSLSSFCDFRRIYWHRIVCKLA